MDYAQLIKMYGEPTRPGPERKYSPAVCTGTKKRIVAGYPEKALVSTSHVERQNLTMRMHMRRFTRLTNAFSKKFENHMHMVALYAMFYNFCRVHKTLRVTPAMEAGLTDTIWDMEDIVKVIEERAPKPGRRRLTKKIFQSDALPGIDTKTEIWLPIHNGGRLNEKYMSSMVEQANHWSIVQASFPSY